LPALLLDVGSCDKCLDIAWSVCLSLCLSVSLSVSVYLLITTVSPAQMAELIEMLFEDQTCVGPSNHALYGVMMGTT